MALKRRKQKTTLKTRRVEKKNRLIVKDEAPCDYFPSGSTRLNLALSGKWDRGWARGRVDNIVGDRSAGKTLLALEAGANFFYFLPMLKSKIWPMVKNPIVVYNNAEGVLDFNIKKMYGRKFYKNLILMRSPNVQHMGRDFTRRAENLDKGESLLYIVDTWDFLRSKEQITRYNESVESDGDEKGTYDAEKQKWASGFFAKTSELMNQNETDATLMIISQIRMTMNAKPFQKSKYRTGGKAFDHAMHQEAWIWQKNKVEGTRYGEKRIYSINVGVKVEKNKTAKPYREAEFNILYDYGIDDLSSLVEYVIGKPSTRGPKRWQGQKFTSTRQAVMFIEENNYEKKIRKQAADKFIKVERAFEKEVSERKARWDSPIAD